MSSPIETGAGVFPEEDLRDELVARGEPIVSSAGDLLALFGVDAADRDAITEIDGWFEELGIATRPRLLEAGDASRSVTVYMREWGAPAEPGANGRLDLAAQLALETGMPTAAAAQVVERLDPDSDFITGLRTRAAGPTAEPAARPKRRRKLRIASYVMFVVGALLLLEAGITVVWQEPFSAIYSARAQARLEEKLERLEEDEHAREAREKQRLLAAERREERRTNRRLSPRRKQERRIAALADSFSIRIGEGKPLGEMSIPKLDVKQVLVQGTKGGTLRQGPGHYRGTTLPGQNGTVGIAGHRTTYSAPFKRLNELKKGDEVFIKLPYGLFTYRIEGTKVIEPNNIGAFRRAGYNRLMMTACHPLFSDKQRIIAWGRLEEVVARGAAVVEPAARRAPRRKAAPKRARPRPRGRRAGRS